MKIGIVVPHIFMQDRLLEDVIFSPAELAIELAEQIEAQGHSVTLYTPGLVTTQVRNVTGDLRGFDDELSVRGYGYIELLKKHPLTFATLARQVQADLVARAYEDANLGALDIVHVYANEEDIGLHFARFCSAPVVFTHHDPYNLTVGYKQLFPKKKDLNFIAVSESQKTDMPSDTNWAATIYHGVNEQRFSFDDGPRDYFLYMGRIIEAKGTHLAIDAVNLYNQNNSDTRTLKLAGKYYQDEYFESQIKPRLNDNIEFIGFVRSDADKQKLIGGAAAMLVPSTFKEPFGMVAIEALACGTPVVGFRSGALPEIVQNTQTGYIVDDEHAMAAALSRINRIEPTACRADFETRFTSRRMAEDYIRVSTELLGAP